VYLNSSGVPSLISTSVNVYVEPDNVPTAADVL